jgi:ParB family protein of integrating conjugative element (PFGI_1 class)
MKSKVSTQDKIAAQIQSIVQNRTTTTVQDNTAYRIHGENKLIKVSEVIPFEKNPRIHDNQEYETIKQSIRERGLESRLFVCKRPGSEQWMLAKGGSTRLKILQELAIEQPERFEEVMFVAIQHPGEAEMVAGHMVENISRGEMCFWDIAHGLKTLREQLVKDAGKDFSNQVFLDKLRAMGLEKFNEKTIKFGTFALENLQALGPWQVHLKLRHVMDSLSSTVQELQDTWKSRKGSGSFQSVIDKAISDCVSSQPEYSVDVLVASMREGVYQALRISPNEPLKTNSSSDSASKNVQKHADSKTDQSRIKVEPTGLGYTVVKAQDVKPIPPKKSRLNDPPGVGGGPLTPEELEAYRKYKGSLEFALADLRETLVEFCKVGGLAHLITESKPGTLPYGLYMELPKEPMTDLHSLPACVWWLAAYFLLQFEQAQVDRAPFKTGSGTWLDFISNQERHSEIKQRIFGGNAPDMGKMIGYVFITLGHPLAGPLLGLWSAMGQVDALLRSQG